MRQLKIIVFIVALCITGSVLATAWWFYTRVIGHTTAVAAQIEGMKGKNGHPPDPGIKRFERAIELIGGSDVDTGRTALYELVRTFPDSSRVTEAKRIIGEINMDTLFSQDLNPLKKDYIVQPGDSLLRIAGKNHTTVECIMRANGLQSGMLQPGDHLIVFPLDFELVLDVSAKVVSLLRNQRFFKEYFALDVQLPPGLKVPTETKISDKAAFHRGRRVQASSSEFLGAEKWLMAEKISIRSQPKAKPVTRPFLATMSTTRSHRIWSVGTDRSGWRRFWIRWFGS
ncbi:MAG: LysM peptidoglycan-binding domain-containing protein [Verrucomicrobia bacterium]|nr:LysM peptidoglycan-binding domain-containing protein [Verrucomicrobiota bacterium]